VPRVPDDAPVYSMAVVERMSGLTRRRIRYYESLGLLRPARTPGNRRLYSPADIRRLAEVKELLESGLELQAIVVLARKGRLSAVTLHGDPGSAAEATALESTATLAASRAKGAAMPSGGPARTRASLDLIGLGGYEDAQARLLGRGPDGSLDQLYPAESGRLLTSRLPEQPASWLRLPARPVRRRKRDDPGPDS
jgi:MerR family glutamine synthetase transcriptional repressor